MKISPRMAAIAVSLTAISAVAQADEPAKIKSNKASIIESRPMPLGVKIVASIGLGIYAFGTYLVVSGSRNAPSMEDIGI